MSSADYISVISLTLNILIIPLFVWIWITDRKVVKLEAVQITKEDMKRIYDKLDSISSNFVSSTTCTANHK